MITVNVSIINRPVRHEEVFLLARDVRHLQHEGVPAPVNGVADASLVHDDLPQHPRLVFRSIQQELVGCLLVQTGGQIPIKECSAVQCSVV